MFKSTSLRNSRCIDFKVKRALQICVMLGVCIWMVYLVQHSHRKKTSYGEGTKTSSRVGKLGWKNPHPNVDQSSNINARHKEEEDEEKNKHEEQNNTNNINGVEDEILKSKNEQNNNEQKSEHRQVPEDQDIEDNDVNNQESEENNHKTNKEDEDRKSKLNDNQSKEISEAMSETEKEETIEIETNNKEDEEIDQNKIEAKEDMEGNHKQEDEDENNTIENERKENKENDESSEDQDSERNNEEAREEHQTSNVVGLNKTEQSYKREYNVFELDSQTNDTEASRIDQKDKVSNATKPKTTQVFDSNVTTIHQGERSENVIEKNNNLQELGAQDQERKNPSSGYIETLHLQNDTDAISDTTEKQFESLETSKVEDSNLHNTTLKMEDSKPDVKVEQVDSTLKNSSGAQGKNATSEEYNGKDNANGNDHNGLVSASNSFILEEKDVSSENNGHAKKIKNENINTSKGEDGTENEQVESQKEKGELEH